MRVNGCQYQIPFLKPSGVQPSCQVNTGRNLWSCHVQSMSFLYHPVYLRRSLLLCSAHFYAVFSRNSLSCGWTCCSHQIWLETNLFLWQFSFPLRNWNCQTCYDKIAHWRDLQGDSPAQTRLSSLKSEAKYLESDFQKTSWNGNKRNILNYSDTCGVAVILATMSHDELAVDKPGVWHTTNRASVRVRVSRPSRVWWGYTLRRLCPGILLLPSAFPGDRENGVFFGFKTAPALDTSWIPGMIWHISIHWSHSTHSSKKFPAFGNRLDGQTRWSCSYIGLETTRQAMYAATAEGASSRRTFSDSRKVAIATSLAILRIAFLSRWGERTL